MGVGVCVLVQFSTGERVREQKMMLRLTNKKCFVRGKETEIDVCESGRESKEGRERKRARENGVEGV